MKKFVICMLFFTTNVFAEKINTYYGAWKVGETYNTAVSGETVIGQYSYFTTVLIAREIYENGGKFCPTRIVGSTSYGDVMLHYQDNPSFKCYTICKPEYHGSTCEEKGLSSTCGNTDYESIFKDKLKINTKSDVSLPSTSIDAFHAGLTTSGYDEKYQLTTLGIIDYIPNGIIVAPIKISTENLRSISVKTNNQATTLCASGYILQGEECVKSCTVMVAQHKSNNEPTGGTTYCKGYNNYDSTKHYLVEESTCYSYLCKEGGFDMNSNRKDCIEDCGETKKSGILESGDCKTCNDNQIFKDGDCVDYQPLSAKDLIDGLCNVRNCWMESSPAKYSDCVFRKWNSQENKCN